MNEMNKNKPFKKPLLQWIEDDDPELVPVMLFSATSTTASYFGVPERTASTQFSFTEVQKSPITPEMIVKCGKETGIHFLAKLGQPTVFDAIEFIDEIEMTVEKETDANGVNRRFTTIRTPEGELSEIFETPPDAPAAWATHFVKTDKDLPAFTYLIERVAKAVIEDVRVREKVIAGLRVESAKWPREMPLYVSLAIPAFELMCGLYVEAEEATYLLADHPSLMERLFEVHSQTLAVWIKCAEESGADFLLGAINGLELFSPTIYERYFVPEARSLYGIVHAHGMRGWVHTCGHMQKLIDMGVYERMGVDVLESFSSPPLGDVTDLCNARIKLGHKIVTRGALNVDLFYDSRLNHIRDRTRVILEETRGYRHMIGDTNDSYPPYPRENILTVVDEVQKSGRMFRS